MTTTFSATRYPFCGHITLSATMTSCVTSLLRWNTPFFCTIVGDWKQSVHKLLSVYFLFFCFFFGCFFLDGELEVFFPVSFSFLGVFDDFIWCTFFALRNNSCCIFLLTVWKYHKLTKLWNIDLIFTYFQSRISSEYLKSVSRTTKVKIYYPSMSRFEQACTTNKGNSLALPPGVYICTQAM